MFEFSSIRNIRIDHKIYYNIQNPVVSTPIKKR